MLFEIIVGTYILIATVVLYILSKHLSKKFGWKWILIFIILVAICYLLGTATIAVVA